MNDDRVSPKSKYLSIEFSVPEKFCEMNKYGTECVPDEDYIASLYGKTIILLYN